MESQPQNPEFRINPENFHPWVTASLEVLCCILEQDTLLCLVLKHPNMSENYCGGCKASN